jgi:hypothetical protein
LKQTSGGTLADLKWTCWVAGTVSAKSALSSLLVAWKIFFELSFKISYLQSYKYKEE